MAIDAWQWTGSALVIAGSTAIGWKLSEQYRRRPLELRKLASVLRALRAEISYARVPLPDAFETASKRFGAHRALADLFAFLAAELQRPGVTVDEAFARGLREKFPATALLGEDGDILGILGKTAGQIGYAEQADALDAAVRMIEEREREALDERARFARLYQTAGLLTGVLIVILLI